MGRRVRMEKVGKEVFLNLCRDLFRLVFNEIKGNYTMACSGSDHLLIIYHHLHGSSAFLQSIVIAAIYLDLCKNLEHEDMTISILQMRKMRLREGLSSWLLDYPGALSCKFSIPWPNIPPDAIPSLPPTLLMSLDPVPMRVRGGWGGAFSHSDNKQLAGYPTIEFNSDTVYLEVASVP